MTAEMLIDGGSAFIKPLSVGVMLLDLVPADHQPILPLGPKAPQPRLSTDNGRLAPAKSPLFSIVQTA